MESTFIQAAPKVEFLKIKKGELYSLKRKDDDQLHYIVLATGMVFDGTHVTFEAMIVYASGEGTDPVGAFSKVWLAKEFEEFHGTITLQS